MNRSLLVFTIAWGTLPLAATTSVQVSSVTATQAVLQVDTSNTTQACTYQVSESQSFSPPAHDVDPALFANSNLDIVQSGPIDVGHRVFVAGKRLVNVALDGKRYSRALEANATYYYSVTCGSDVITGQFTTANPPLGSSYPELPPFDPTSFGNVADPTINWLDQSQYYIDPLTGIRIVRATGPGDDGNIVTGNGFSFAFDVNGKWSNAAAAISSAGGQASTAASNAPLFLSWSEIRDYQLTWGGANFSPSQGTVDDLLFHLTGSGGATLSVCISLDSGQTCASNPIPMTLPSGISSATPVPANFPSPMFAGWGAAFSMWDLANHSGGGASAIAGSQTVTAASGSFNVTWKPGVKIFVAGSGCNGTGVCTLAKVVSSSQITTVESIANQVSNANWQSYAAGVRITVSSGSANLSNASFDYAESVQSIMGDNTNQVYCSLLQVTDVYKDANGAPLSTPLSGRLCNFATSLYLLIDATGEFRVLSNYLMGTNAPFPGKPVTVPTGGAFSGTDPKTFYGTLANTSIVVQGVYTGDYTPYKAGGTSKYATSGPVNDAVTWTNLMTGPNGISQQLLQQPNTSYYQTSLFQPPNYLSVLGGYGEFFVQPTGSGDRLCTLIRYNFSTQQIQQVLDSWSTWPMRWGACHYAPNGGGTYQIGVFNQLNQQNPSTPLGGPFQLNLTQVMKGGIWQNNTALTESNITTALNTSPVQVSTSSTTTDVGYRTSNVSGFIDGEPVFIFGASSNPTLNTPTNGNYYVKATYSDTALSAPIGYTDTIIPVVDPSRVIGLTPLIQIDSELIRCAGYNATAFTGCVRGSQYTAATSHLAGALVHQANSFALYLDAALTQPLSGIGQYYDNGGTYVMDVDVCPTGLSPQWTTNMIFDSQGAVGQRCNTIRVAGEPFSNYAYFTPFSIGNGLSSVSVMNGVATINLSSPFTAWQVGQQVVISGSSSTALNGALTIASIVNSQTITVSAPGVANGAHTEGSLLVRHPTEHYAYPNPANPTNLNQSSLQTIQPGDFLNDLAGIPYDEQIVVVNKVVNSPTDIVLTVMRHWGDEVFCDPFNRLSGAMIHNNGWIPYLMPSYGCQSTFAYANITDAGWSIGDPRISGTHYDIAPGAGTNLYTFVGSGGYLSVANEPFAQIMTTAPAFGANEVPIFASSSAELSQTTLQDYPAFRQETASAAQKVWKEDFHALMPAFGSQQDSAVGLTSPMSLASIRGTQYDAGSQTTIVYKVTAMPSGLDRKNIPIMGFSGYHYLTDMSAPASVITDSNAWRICVADFAGECRPNSNQNDVFVSLPGADSGNGNCFVNTYELNIPCIFSANSFGGWAVQEQITPPDTNATGGRRLSMGFVNPGRHFSFSNWVATPDASWGLLSPPWINGVRNDIFAMKLPPWPASDGINRSSFVNYTVNVPPIPGAITARAVFGYAENGSPSQFFCTTRQEMCTTSSSSNEPFAWASEPQTLQNCDSGCDIAIPMIPGRVAYYRIDWMDGAGNVLTSGPINAAAATP